MRIQFGMSVLVGVLMVAGSGCAGGGAVDDGQPEIADDADGKSDVTRPRGSYQNTQPEVGDLRALTLNADKTFSRQFQYVDCVPKAVCDAETGTYRFTRGGSTTYIRFTDGSGHDLGRYAYRLAGDSLTLRADGDTHTFVMDKVASGAQAGEACGGFAGIPCADGLECKLSGNYPDAGGTCVAKDGGAKICGGIAGLTCPAGYTCKLDGSYPDASGTCVAASTGAKEGETCGGFAGIPCADGLECKLSGSYPDASGTCVSKSDPCGGCGSGDYCSYCFGRYACIPNGALC